MTSNQSGAESLKKVFRPTIFGKKDIADHLKTIKTPPENYQLIVSPLFFN